MRKWILIFFGCYLLTQLALKETDGFTVAKLAMHLENFDGLTRGEKNLAPKYQYLTKGGQAYVFASADGKTVLKFFRGSKRKRIELLHRVLHTVALKQKLKREKAYLKEAMDSYCIAHMNLAKETGILSTHFKKTKPMWICIVDKLGIEHTIDANLYPFVIQKKAILVKDHIHQLMENQNLSEAKNALRNLLDLVHIRAEKGISDKDPNLTKNFGFIGNQPIQIDAGRFSIGPFLNKQVSCSKEDMQHWINKHHPELSESFYEMD